MQFMQFLISAWRKLNAASKPLSIDAELEAAARKTWRETFPDRWNPPVTFWIEADGSDYVVVGVSNLDPGSVQYIRVSKDGRLGTFVAEDQQRYRPLGLK